MKTTETELTDISIKGDIKPVNSANISPLRSLRPQKSMVRVKSLKPRRMNIASKVSVRTTKIK